MKKIALIITCIAFLHNMYAQSNSPFYYYKGEQIVLTESTDSVFVYFDNSLITADGIAQKYNIVKQIILDDSKSDTLSAYIINYTGDKSTLKNNPEVWNIEPVVNGMPVSNVFYIQLKSAGDTNLLYNLSSTYGTTVLGAIPECERWYIVATNRNTPTNALEACNLFWESGLIADVTPGFIPEIPVNPVSQPNRTSSQWGLDAINASNAWNTTTGNSNIKVAIISNGASESHQEFIGTNIVDSYNTITGQNNANQTGGEATMQAGIIFANHNYANIDGIAPGASMMNISITGASNEYLFGRIAIAINHAVNNNADIILEKYCQSWSLPQTLLENAINNAVNSGCIIIFPSGDYTDGIHYVKYPSNYNSKSLVAGGVDVNYSRATLSCYSDELDIVAPSQDIYSSFASQYNLINDYITSSGTYLAAAHVSGVAALMLSANSNLTVEQVARIIKGTAQKVGGYSYQYSSDHLNGTWHEEMGHGLVDAAAAVSAAAATPNHDFYIRDNTADNGTEPNTTTGSVSASPDIVITDMADNVVSELLNGANYKIKVTVHNKSAVTATLCPTNVKVHWTLETSNLQWGNSWTNAGTQCGVARSGTASLPANGFYFCPQISSYGSSTVTIPWTAPDYINSQCANMFGSYVTVTMVAEVIDGGLTIGKTATDSPLDHYVRTNNNIARKSYSMLIDYNQGEITSISPNPTSGDVVVGYTIADNDSDVQLLLTNTYGTPLLRTAATGGSCRLATASLPAGQYLVHLIVDNTVKDTKPLIVQ